MPHPITTYRLQAGSLPAGNYVQFMGTTDFIWPVTNKVYASRSTTKKRAALLESFGATVIVEQSSRITWPEPDYIDEPEEI